MVGPWVWMSITAPDFSGASAAAESGMRWVWKAWSADAGPAIAIDVTSAATPTIPDARRESGMGISSPWVPLRVTGAVMPRHGPFGAGTWRRLAGAPAGHTGGAASRTPQQYRPSLVAERLQSR